MPKTPRFSTPTAQQTAVGVAAFLSFAAALGLALLYTASHQPSFGASLSEQRVGDLRLLLPDQWQRQDSDASGLGFESEAVAFIDPAIIGRTININSPSVIVPLAPEEVLRATLNLITLRGSRVHFDKEQVQRFRAGTMTGAYYHAHSQAPGKETISSDRFVVLTEDGRRHWVIAMHMPLHPSSQVEKAQDTLMMQIARSAVDTSSREASLPEIEAAGLTAIASASDSLMLRSRNGAVEDDQLLHFTLTHESVPHFGMLRVRPLLDAANITPAASVSAMAGLARHYTMVHGRGPENSQLTLGNIAGRTATRLTLSDGKVYALHREVIHVNIDDDHALLFDLLAEAPALELMNEQVAALVQARLKQNTTDQSTEQGKGELTLALERGRDLATAQRDHMVKQFTAARKAFLFRRNGMIIGTQLVNQQHLPEQGLPLRSRKMRAVVRGRDTRIAWANWFVSIDGQTIESTSTMEIREGLTQQSYTYLYSLKDNSLTASMLPPRPGRDPIWTQKVAPGYVPGFAEDSWDLSTLARLNGQGPILVWRSRDTQPPEPHWIEYVALDQGPLAEKLTMPDGAFAFVRIRPMMNMDGLRLWLDRDGKVIASDWIEPAEAPTGGMRMSLTPTDMQTVHRLYASHDFLRLWQQDVDQP